MANDSSGSVQVSRVETSNSSDQVTYTDSRSQQWVKLPAIPPPPRPGEKRGYIRGDRIHYSTEKQCPSSK